MRFLLAAVNAKYIHSNPGVYSLKRYAEEKEGAGRILSGQVLEEPVQQGCKTRGEPGLSAGSGREPAKDMDIRIAEYTINHQPEQVLEDLYRQKPDVIGFSCYIWNIDYVRELVHDLHKVLPDTDIWLGGPEVSYDAPLLLEQEPEVLGIMKGEGEATFAGLLACYCILGGAVRRRPEAVSAGTMCRRPEAVSAGMMCRRPEAVSAETMGGQPKLSCSDEAKQEFWQSLQQLSGIAFRGGDGRVRETGIRPPEDLSRIPFLYSNLDGLEHRIVYYESSRGCPFSCSYCLSSLEKSVRFRDLGLVRKELNYFLEQKVLQVKFVDRTFNCNKEHAMAIWQHILQHDNGVTNFHFEVAADLMDEEELALIGRMRPGLIQLEIGVQSTNPDTIREIHRRMDLGRVRQVLARIRQGHNVHQHLDLIAGLPFESYDSFRRSFDEVYAMVPDQLQLGFLKVLKGSYMYGKAKGYELVYREKPPYEVLSTRWLSYEELCRLKGIEAMVETYYNSGQFANTLRLLVREFSGPFELYECLAEYYEKKGLNGRNHSRMARYEILEDFIRECLGQQCGSRKTQELLTDSLVYDCYLRENCKSRPGFALDLGPYKDMLRSLVPQQRSLGSQVHAEVFRSGAVWLFDYRIRDPLTRNASVRRLL